MPVDTATGPGVLDALMRGITAVFAAIGLTSTSFGIGGALAALVVMCLNWPKSAREGIIALVTTLAGSFGGGAVLIIKLDLMREATNVIDAFAIIGIVFMCGLPGWLLVRLFFAQMAKVEAEGKGLVELIKDIRGAL